MDRLRLMETFCRVVERGSFSAVAREEMTTQSAISKQVQALETELGATLLVRSTRSHSLTEAGQLYYERCRQVLDALEDARIEVQRAEHDISGMLRVAAPAAFGRQHIVPRLQDFYARYPRVKVDLQLDDSFVDLVAAGVDVAFRVGELKDSRLVARRIGTAHRAALASPAYLARHGEPRTPAELAGHRCIVIGDQRRTDWRFLDADGDGGAVVRVDAAFLTNDGGAAHQLALAGSGIALKSIWDVGDDLSTGRLRRVLPHHAIAAAPLHAVYPHQRNLPPRVRLFVEYLRERLGEAWRW